MPKSGIQPHKFVGEKKFTKGKHGTHPNRCTFEGCGATWWHSIHNEGKSSKKKSAAKNKTPATKTTKKPKVGKKSVKKKSLTRLTHKQREKVLDIISDPNVQIKEKPYKGKLTQVTIPCPHCDGKGSLDLDPQEVYEAFAFFIKNR